MDIKKCKTCNNELSLSLFDKDKNGRLGVRGSCKKCTKLGKDNDRIKKRMKLMQSHIQRNGDIRYWKKRAKCANERALNRYGIKNSLSGDDLMQKFNECNRCYYCFGDLTHLSAEIEHLIPLSIGGSHHIDNVVFACHICNQLKSSKSDLDFFKHIESIYLNLKDKYNK